MVTRAAWRRVLFDRSHMAIDAAVNGIGIALESDLMMWRELQDGALVVASGAFVSLEGDPMAGVPA